MNRLDFIKSLGTLIGAAFVPKAENTSVELMRITSNGNIGMGVLNPKQILEVTKRVNGGMSPLYKRIK
jgi:hypothetical protein